MAESNHKNIVFGAMALSTKDGFMSGVYTLEEANELLNIFQKHGHTDVDTSRIYGAGTSEGRLQEAEWKKRGLRMDTKIAPTHVVNPFGLQDKPYTLSPEDLRRSLEASLKALGTDRIHMWYLHSPDRSVPLEPTLRELNRMHQEGLFEQWGVSAYQAWEVAQICEICDKNGWVRPKVYQGIYHAWQRVVEAELFPCLRHYGMAFYGHTPLAGGFLSNRYQRNQENFESKSRFDPGTMSGKMLQGLYFNEAYFKAQEILRPVVERHGIAVDEAALRWLNYHSQLKREHGDSILIGASKPKHMENNMQNFDKGPLPEEVVAALDQGWQQIRGRHSQYWR